MPGRGGDADGGGDRPETLPRPADAVIHHRFTFARLGGERPATPQLR